MNIANIPTGRYVVAVSGGIDSVVLLDMLVRQSQLELIVAHFDHGIRPDSASDAAFVARLAQKYNLLFEMERQELGSSASEQTARQARYNFLRRIAAYHQATLVTAHHQDDLLETACINLQRGTGWRGLSSLRDSPQLRRPLLGVTKAEILTYAQAYKLDWQEDSTNNDLRYLRNDLRKNLLPRFNVYHRQEMLSILARQAEIRVEIDEILTTLPNVTTWPRQWLIGLPAAVQAEILRAIAVRITGQSLEQMTLRRARWFIATARPHKILQMTKFLEIQVQKSTVVVRVRAI